MFGGAIHIRFQNVCHPTTNESSYCSERAGLVPILMPLSLLALLINAFSLYFFCCQDRKSVMRTSLILLSLSEVAIHFCLNIDYLNVATGVCNYTHEPGRIIQVLVSGIASINNDAFLSLRNWCQALITVSRAEVVIKPMKTKRTFSRETIVLSYFVVLFIAFTLAITRTINEQLVICSIPENQLYLDNFIGMDTMDKFDSYLFFHFQATVPVAIVFTMSNVIVARISPWTSTSITASNARRRNQMKATRTVLFLAGIFTVFQMPTVIFSILQELSLLDDETIMHRAQLTADILLCLDSLLNILVYISGIPELRNFLQPRFLRFPRAGLNSSGGERGTSPGHFFSTANSNNMTPTIPLSRSNQTNNHKDRSFCQFVSSV